MIIAFHLNGNPVEMDLMPHRRTVHILKEDFQCRSLKQRCYNTRCGSCLILFDDRPVRSCILPAFELRSRDLWTMEGLANRKSYIDILNGFKESNIQLCSLCAPSRALATEALLRQTLRPTAEQLREAAESVQCDCSSTPRILDAMLRSARHRERRLHDT